MTSEEDAIRHKVDAHAPVYAPHEVLALLGEIDRLRSERTRIAAALRQRSKGALSGQVRDTYALAAGLVELSS